MSKKLRFKKWIANTLYSLMGIGFTLLVVLPILAFNQVLSRVGGEHFVIVFTLIFIPTLLLDKYYWN